MMFGAANEDERAAAHRAIKSKRRLLLAKAHSLRVLGYTNNPTVA
jgi:hypothetical protein